MLHPGVLGYQVVKSNVVSSYQYLLLFLLVCVCC